MAEVQSNLLCLAESSKLDYDAVLDDLSLEEQVPNSNESTLRFGEGENEDSIDEALNSFVEKYNQPENTSLVPSTPATVSSTTPNTNQTKEQAPTIAIRNSPSPSSSTSTISRSSASSTPSTSCPSLILQFESLTFSLFSSSPQSSSLSTLSTGNTEASKPEVLFADKPSLFKANLETLLQELQSRLSVSNVDVSLEFPELQLTVSSHMIYAQKVSLAHLYEITKVISSRSAKPLSFHAILKVKKNSFVAQYNSLVALTQSPPSGAAVEDSLSSSEQGKDESLLSSDLQSGDELELSEDLEDFENSSSESLSDEEVEELNGDLDVDPSLAVTYSRSPSPTQSPKRTFDDLEDSDGEGDHLTAKRTKV